MAGKYSYWLTTGKYSLLQKMSVLLFGVLAFMLLARYYSPEKFGVWALFILIASIVETSRNALIRNGYVLFMNTKNKEELPCVEMSALVTNCILSASLIIIFLISRSTLENLFNAPGLSTILLYYSFALILLIPFSQLEINLYAKTNFQGVFWLYFLRNGVFTLMVVIIYLFKPIITLGQLSVFYGLSILPGIFAGLYYVRKHDSRSFIWNKKVFKEFIGYGKYVFGNNIFSLIFVSTDSLMTARWISSVAFSFYNVGSRILNFVDIPSQVLSDVMFPRAAQMSSPDKKADMKRIYEKTVAATLSFILPVVLIVFVFADQFVLIIAGNKYLAATPVLKIMIFYTLFLPFIKQFGNIMDAKGKPHTNFWLMLIFCIINFISNYLFISEYGLLGAAYGTLATYILLFISTQIILFRSISSSIFNIFRYTIHFYPEYLKGIKKYISK